MTLPVEFRADQESRIKIRVHRDVESGIARELRRRLHPPGFSPAEETGGLLAGVRLGNGSLTVRAMCGPAADATHEPGAFSNPWEAQDDFQRSLYGNGFQILGDFHTHTRRDDIKPSEVDVRGWAAASYELIPLPHYLGVIATPPRPSWPGRSVNLYAWVTTSDRSGTLVCQPAAVEVFD